MKKEIHPTYFPNAKIECACGTSFEVGSTAEEISIELCSNCHPFYTGKQKLVDTARRVEKFQERTAKQGGTADKKAKEAARKAKRAEKADK